MKLSSDRIESFCGDVLPLRLESEEDISREDINWEAARGRLRVYGNEEIVPFPPRNARYVKFSALGTVGAYRGTGKLKDANVMIAELSLFTK